MLGNLEPCFAVSDAPRIKNQDLSFEESDDGPTKTIYLSRLKIFNVCLAQRSERTVLSHCSELRL